MFPPLLCLFLLFSLLLCFPLRKLPPPFPAPEKRLYLRDQDTGQYLPRHRRKDSGAACPLRPYYMRPGWDTPPPQTGPRGFPGPGSAYPVYGAGRSAVSAAPGPLQAVWRIITRQIRGIPGCSALKSAKVKKSLSFLSKREAFPGSPARSRRFFISQPTAPFG